MIYPEIFEQKVGFDKIRKILLNNCISDLGKRQVDSISFSTDLGIVRKSLSLTDELKKILLFETGFPTHDYFELKPELERIAVAGSYILSEKLLELNLSLRTIQEIIQFIKSKEKDTYPELKDLINDVTLDFEILKQIDKIIDNKGQIKDGASVKLKSIRKEQKDKTIKAERLIIQTFNSAKKSGWIKEEENITIRNGRVVLPVNVANKNKLKGFIHDESSTGQTVFIEPYEVFEINNEIRELEYEEKREIIKILIKISDFLRPQLIELHIAFDFLGNIDFIRSKAKLAIELNAIKPEIINEAFISWYHANHPLLFLSHKTQGKKIVSQDIHLDKDQRILIISGPNAGGKSVCLKTIGLLQYMVQCGLLIPVDESSKTGIFQQILIDIGDEQSLENDLSTYSSHLLNLKYFAEHVDEHSLFLIDELGSGTEPQLGGAIAEAILEVLNERNSFGVITTHYANLKLLADQTNSISNGAMLFDSKKLQPLYKLKIGKPGSSFAFEIAKKIGFSNRIINEAVRKTGKTQLDFDKQLQQLEIEKSEIDKKNTQIKVADDFLSEMIDKYEKLVKEAESSKNKIFDEAKKEANELIKNSNKLIEKTIKEIRESQADKIKTKDVREKLKTFTKN
ncbi:endonuclease MutS2, partial [candidate division KSB1 bacterium]